MPDVTVTDVPKGQGIIVLASDGLWDVLPRRLVQDIFKGAVDGDPKVYFDGRTRDIPRRNMVLICAEIDGGGLDWETVRRDASAESPEAEKLVTVASRFWELAKKRGFPADDVTVSVLHV